MYAYISLFRKKMLMLDEKLQPNTSKLAIFYIGIFAFSLFILCYFIFVALIMDALIFALDIYGGRSSMK